MTSLFKFDEKISLAGVRVIAGVDEAGRGPLAGPVAAAAVILPRGFRLKGLRDSKELTAKKREKFFTVIAKSALSFGVGVVGNSKIDSINIYRASILAMRIAFEKLSKKPDVIIIDGPYKIPGVRVKQLPVIGGDSKSAAVACASIIAKVTRDRIMTAYDRRFPGYGFAKHKGYGTKEHYAALGRHGPCSIHRRSFNLGGRARQR
jgi:ribonuclease HII